jgi:enoyl-CoA hydratase/carnithine racemase
METAVIFETRDHVAYITLNRPDKKNAINRTMRKEIQQAYFQVKNDPDIWAAVMTGNGEVFCAGKDLFEKLSPGEDDGSVMTNDELYLFQRFIYKPFVLALNGPCLAQGGGFALNADIVIFSERASIGWPQVKRGISSVSGPSYLPHAIAWNQAMACLMRGRYIEAQEALKLGLANEVVAPDQLLATAERWVREILGNAPLAVSAIKEAARRGQELPVVDRMYLARDIANRVLLSDDAEEGVKAFREKRAAVWTGT